MAPGCFSGVDNEDFDKFLYTVELYRITLGLSEKEVEKCAALVGLLEEVAYDKYSQLETVVKKNLKNLVAALQAEFGERRKTIYRQPFLESVQSATQDFSSFVNELGRLARLGYAGESNETVVAELREREVQACRDASTRQFPLENEGNEWEELVKATQLKEDAHNVEKRMVPSGAGSGVAGAVAAAFNEPLVGSILTHSDHKWIKKELEEMDKRIVN